MPAIKVSTELEMTSDAQQNGGKVPYVKHCKCAKPVNTQKIQASDWPK